MVYALLNNAYWIIPLCNLMCTCDLLRLIEVTIQCVLILAFQYKIQPQLSLGIASELTDVKLNILLDLRFA